jgi:hypothetical protein
MYKRRKVSVTVLSAFALTMICLLSAAAQKGPQSTAGSVRPVKGIDVIVQKNPGNTAARTGTSNEKGEVEFAGLEPGSYSLAIVDHSKQQKVKGSVGGDVLLGNCLVEITGAVGGPISREWNVKESKFVTPLNATARAATPAPSYEEKISLEIGSGSPAPVLKFIIKSKSNISSN